MGQKNFHFEKYFWVGFFFFFFGGGGRGGGGRAVFLLFFLQNVSLKLILTNLRYVFVGKNKSDTFFVKNRSEFLGQNRHNFFLSK